MTISQIRSQFPQLVQTVYGKPLVYLDNAATSLRPLGVLRKWEEMSTVCNSNLHRAVHHTAAVATEAYEDARDFVKDYLNAASREEIVFTSGDTASINLVAYSFGEAFVGCGDNVVVTESEHHSNIVPWQLLCGRKKAELRAARVTDTGEIDLDSLRGLIDSRTRIVCTAHVSNVLGIVNPVKEIASICHAAGVPLLVDGAQGIVHCDVDVRDIDCDFYTFSGHKVYAAPGTGVLYGKKEWLDRMPPFMAGGEMIETVKLSGSTWAPLPRKFEAGTQNISGTPTLVPALEMAKLMKVNKLEEECIRNYVWSELSAIQGLHIFGNPSDSETKVPLFSFIIDGVHHEDLALILDKMGVAVRSGQMCAEPLMDRFGVTGMLRASIAPYNTKDDATHFITSLRRAIGMLV